MWVLYTMILIVAVVALFIAWRLCFPDDDMPDIEDVEDAGLKPRDPRQGRF